MKKGEYVLATKWSDGDPQDHWFVGFYDGDGKNDRHMVVDNDGRQGRMNGFRKVKKISANRGKFLLENAREIEMSGRRLGWWLRQPLDMFKTIGATR
jgi:hypothetical protein